MIPTIIPQKAARLLPLVLAVVFTAGFWLPTVAAPAGASTQGQVIVIGVRAAPALM